LYVSINTLAYVVYFGKVSVSINVLIYGAVGVATYVCTECCSCLPFRPYRKCGEA
jgi:hypothetical protein